MRIYFDHNATTPVDPTVAKAVVKALEEDFGNASSVHHFGQRAKGVLDDARSSVAALIGAEPSEVVFTSGGTEADNFAIRGVAEALEPTGRKHLIASSIEHEAVLNTLKSLARRGWTTTGQNSGPSTGRIDSPPKPFPAEFHRRVIAVGDGTSSAWVGAPSLPLVGATR